MTFRTVLIMALALVFGGSAALGINSLRNAPPPPPAVETTPVVVAVEDISRFATLSADQLRVREFPKDLVPPGAFSRLEDVISRVALSGLAKGEPVLDSRLAAKGAGRGMGPGIAPGKRAFTIQTANVAAVVAGFILPGSRVDVLLTVPGDVSTGGAVTVTLLQNVEILAVDQRVDIPADNKVDVKELRSATLLVTPNEAAKLDLGQNKGTLHLALRNPEDNQIVPTRRATLADIGLVQQVVGPALAKLFQREPPPPPRPLTIRTVHGARVGQVYVDPPAGR
jgi:pilus assembly protein CpaB